MRRRAIRVSPCSILDQVQCCSLWWIGALILLHVCVYVCMCVCVYIWKTAAQAWWMGSSLFNRVLKGLGRKGSIIWKGLGWLRGDLSGANMGPTWAKLEPNWGQHRPNLSQLGANLDPSWVQIGPSKPSWNKSWGYLEASWGIHHLRCQNWFKIDRDSVEKLWKVGTFKDPEDQHSLEKVSLLNNFENDKKWAWS